MENSIEIVSGSHDGGNDVTNVNRDEIAEDLVKKEMYALNNDDGEHEQTVNDLTDNSNGTAVVDHGLPSRQNLNIDGPDTDNTMIRNLGREVASVSSVMSDGELCKPDRNRHRGDTQSEIYSISKFMMWQGQLPFRLQSKDDYGFETAIWEVSKTLPRTPGSVFINHSQEWSLF